MLLAPKRDKKQYVASVLVSANKKEKAVFTEFQVDTGALCSTLTLRDYKRITSTIPEQSDIKLKLYDQMVIHPGGSKKLYCTVNGLPKKVHSKMADHPSKSLLSGRASKALQLIHFNQEYLMQSSPSSHPPLLNQEQVLHEYHNVFSCLGKLPSTYHINMDPNAKAVQEKPWRIPIPVKDELKIKINELEAMSVIAKVTKPTPWISNMVVVRKPNKLRLCLNPLHLNKGIIRNHYPTPTVEDIAPKLTKAKVFPAVDATDGFLQVVLDEPSSCLTTYGRYRWLPMPFRIKSAPEEFQRRLNESLEGLTNIAAVHDDIVIFGSGDSIEEATSSHDLAFRALLDRCRERGLKLNKKKLCFKLSKVAYMGHVLGADGLQADPEKITTICEMPRPTDVQGVQCLIGVVTYLSKFLPQLSTVCEPLGHLSRL